jgi:hypothetical protein
MLELAIEGLRNKERLSIAIARSSKPVKSPALKHQLLSGPGEEVHVAQRCETGSHRFRPCGM